MSPSTRDLRCADTHGTSMSASVLSCSLALWLWVAVSLLSGTRQLLFTRQRCEEVLEPPETAAVGERARSAGTP